MATRQLKVVQKRLFKDPEQPKKRGRERIYASMTEARIAFKEAQHKMGRTHYFQRYLTLEEKERLISVLDEMRNEERTELAVG